MIPIFSVLVLVLSVNNVFAATEKVGTPAPDTLRINEISEGAKLKLDLSEARRVEGNFMYERSSAVTNGGFYLPRAPDKYNQVIDTLSLSKEVDTDVDDNESVFRSLAGQSPSCIFRLKTTIKENTKMFLEGRTLNLGKWNISKKSMIVGTDRKAVTFIKIPVTDDPSIDMVFCTLVYEQGKRLLLSDIKNVFAGDKASFYLGKSQLINMPKNFVKEKKGKSEVH